MDESTIIEGEVSPVEVISLPESARLVTLEKTISSGLQTFVAVGEALMEIRDSRLYRVEHATFEEYCKVKWDFTDNFARRMIRGAEVVENIKTVPIGTLPQSESQTRPLAKLKPKQQAEVWQKAVERSGGQQPTAKVVEAVVSEVSKSSPQTFDTPAHGLRYSMLAIEQMKKIQPRDREKWQAGVEVVEWISEHVFAGKRPACLAEALARIVDTMLASDPEVRARYLAEVVLRLPANEQKVVIENIQEAGK
jgi:hypothetical protein